MYRLRPGALFLLPLLLAPAALADAPPAPAELQALLQRERIATTSWTTWRSRLKDWSGEHFEAAQPAFGKAYAFVKGQLDGKGSLPKALAKDGVAWMVLGVGSLSDPELSQAPVAQAQKAEAHLKKALQYDKELARAHQAMGLALRQAELTPPAQGGPVQPNARNLQSALAHLQDARRQDPKIQGLPPRDLADLALKAGKKEDAEGYVQQVLKDHPDDQASARLYAGVVAAREWHRDGRRAPLIKPLATQFPHDGAILSYYAAALAHDDNWDEAVSQLDKARRQQADPAALVGADAVRKIDEYANRKRKDLTEKKRDEDRRQAEDARRRQDAANWERTRNAPLEFLSTVGWWALWFTVVYGTVMLLMCLVGLWLAKRTHGPHAADMLGDSSLTLVGERGQVARTRHESKLEKLYLLALLAALVMFYLSLPFIFVGLLLVFALLLLIAVFMRRDREAADAHSAMLRASGGGMKAVFKAMFASAGSGGHGVLKDREDCPRLYQVVEEVAKRVDTEPVDEIWISPGADFGVHQEGRGPFGMFGGRKRVLTLGLCVMYYLSVSEFKAILAHEYAHFSHADTYWNRFLFQVALSLRVAMREMARSGGALTWFNPFYWFFWLYSKSYTLLSAGFSRSREFLADRMACSLYGSDVFSRGLTKVCTDGALFEKTVYGNIVRLLRQRKAFVNMYLAFRDFRETEDSESDRRKLYKRLMDDKESWFSTHPTFKDRLAQARLLPTAKKAETTAALALFEKPEAMEGELTDWLTEVVERYMHH